MPRRPLAGNMMAGLRTVLFHFDPATGSSVIFGVEPPVSLLHLLASVIKGDTGNA